MIGHNDEDERCDCSECRDERAEASHTCIYVGVDDHDECEVCGREMTNEWAYWNWRDRDSGYDGATDGDVFA